MSDIGASDNDKFIEYLIAFRLGSISSFPLIKANAAKQYFPLVKVSRAVPTMPSRAAQARFNH